MSILTFLLEARILRTFTQLNLLCKVSIMGGFGDFVREEFKLFGFFIPFGNKHVTNFG